VHYHYGAVALVGLFWDKFRRGGRSALRYFNTFVSFEDAPKAPGLCSRNEDVARLNEKEPGRMEGEMSLSRRITWARLPK